MSNVRVHSLYIYPIKSLQGIKLEQAELTERGFEYDRHWMLIDEQGRFLSQREISAMAEIRTRMDENDLIISSDKASQDLIIPLKESEQNTLLPVVIWRDNCNAVEVSDEANRWFSKALEQPCKLVYLPKDEQRAVETSYAKNHEQVGFADGYPLLVVSLESIKLLNEKLNTTVDIEQFRPNIVLENCPAHAEDEWQQIQINQIDILLPKPCSRCIIPSIHQKTAQRIPNLLETLATYRRKNRKIMFGMNALHQSLGQIKCGDEVFIKN